jgi:hypothetical protein
MTMITRDLFMYDMKWQEESPGEDLSNAVVRLFQEIDVLVSQKSYCFKITLGAINMYKSVPRFS